MLQTTINPKKLRLEPPYSLAFTCVHTQNRLPVAVDGISYIYQFAEETQTHVFRMIVNGRELTAVEKEAAALGVHDALSARSQPPAAPLTPRFQLDDSRHTMTYAWTVETIKL